MTPEKTVVVVESPAKAKTIKKYLGPGYEVLASYGHVRDLVAKEGAVQPEQQFAMLDSTPEAEQLIGVRDLANGQEEALKMFSTLLGHWARGEAEETGRLMNEEMKETPETARLLLTYRNAR